MTDRFDKIAKALLRSWQPPEWKYLPVHEEELSAVLRKASEEGRRAGLTEAAAFVDDVEGWDHPRLAEAIRSLLPEEKR